MNDIQSISMIDNSSQTEAQEGQCQGHNVAYNELTNSTAGLMNNQPNTADDVGENMYQIYGAKSYKCSICDFSTMWSNSFKYHMMKHKGDTPYVCGLCCSTFARSANLKRHMKIHTGEKQKRPPQGDNMAYSKLTNETDVHVDIQQTLTNSGEKIYKCDSCDYRYAGYGEYKVHLLTHAKVIPLKCDMCPFSTPWSETLNEHMQIHTGAKPYKCTICDFSTSWSRGIKFHMMKHNKNTPKPYFCGVCSSTFPDPYLLKADLSSYKPPPYLFKY